MDKFFNATQLIPLKKGKRTKKVAHFLDNRLLPDIKYAARTYKGRNAYTELPVELLGEYLLWLTPKTREAVLNNIKLQDIVNNIEEYW